MGEARTGMLSPTEMFGSHSRPSASTIHRRTISCTATSRARAECSTNCSCLRTFNAQTEYPDLGTGKLLRTFLARKSAHSPSRPRYSAGLLAVHRVRALPGENATLLGAAITWVCLTTDARLRTVSVNSASSERWVGPTQV